MTDLTPKQLKFCQVYIETGNASEAYRQSYDAENMGADSIKVEASRLLDHPIVSLTIEQIRAQHAQRHAVTVDSITAELEEARQLASMKEQAAPMVQATMGKAKLHGLLEDKIVGDPTKPVAFILNKKIHSADKGS